MKRTLWYEARLDPNANPLRLKQIAHEEYVYGGVNPDRVYGGDKGYDFEHRPNLIGSLIEGAGSEIPGAALSIHMPVIDIDRMPVKLIESTTPGNYHLYIDKEMTWPIFVVLLDALLTAGIIEKGWHDATIKQECAYVRVPGVKKTGGGKSHAPDTE
jgi:hypothetical protein